MTAQDLLVGLVVAAAFAILVGRIVKAYRTRKSKCGTCCGCGK